MSSNDSPAFADGNSIPTEILEQIFINLPAEKYQKLKSVSRTWRDTIEDSSRCMDKLTNVVTKSNHEWFEKDFTSTRKCRNVRFQDASSFDDKIDRYLLKDRWQYVSFKDTVFSNPLSFRNTLKTCSSSVTEINFDSVNITNVIVWSSLRIENLKKLTIKRCSYEVAMKILTRTSINNSISELCVHFEPSKHLHDRELGLLVAEFNRFEDLKKLSCGVNFVDRLFKNTDNIKFNFNLKNLELFEYGKVCGFVYVNADSFSHFLKGQTSLESYSITFSLSNNKKLKPLSYEFKSTREISEQSIEDKGSSVESLTFVYCQGHPGNFYLSSMLNLGRIELTRFEKTRSTYDLTSEKLCNPPEMRFLKCDDVREGTGLYRSVCLSHAKSKFSLKALFINTLKALVDLFFPKL